ncbi:MAG: hypothetical protein JNJ99_15110 [Crocinitomicaceae bacterium]|nr:hypothetical protein [Crocinitomicaceae bacterium]
MSLFKPDNSLVNFFDHQLFVEKTIQQINKDLQGLYYADFGISDNKEMSLLDNLIKNLMPVLLELSKRQPEQLSQFIYKVDLPEKKFHDALSKDQTLELLSFLIIEREAQKVYLRQKFS